MILLCTCSHLVQDQMYGKQMRVFNRTKTGNYRCTVCGKIHASKKDEKKVEKKEEKKVEDKKKK